jgi:hypothetical protein
LGSRCAFLPNPEALGGLSGYLLRTRSQEMLVAHYAYGMFSPVRFRIDDQGKMTENFLVAR